MGSEMCIRDRGTPNAKFQASTAFFRDAKKSSRTFSNLLVVETEWGKREVSSKIWVQKLDVKFLLIGQSAEKLDRCFREVCRCP